MPKCPVAILQCSCLAFATVAIVTFSGSVAKLKASWKMFRTSPSPSAGNNQSRFEKLFSASSYFDVKFTYMCHDDTSCHTGRMAIFRGAINLTRCKAECYEERSCVALGVTGCSYDAVYCGTGCWLYLRSNVSVDVLSSSVPSQKTCKIDENSRCYKLSDQSNTQQRKHAIATFSGSFVNLRTSSKIFHPWPSSSAANSQSGFEQLFSASSYLDVKFTYMCHDDARCHTGSMAIFRGAINLTRCKAECYEEPSCVALGVTGCSYDATYCGTGCWLYLRSDVSVDLLSSSQNTCKIDEDCRCYKLSDQSNTQQRQYAIFYREHTRITPTTSWTRTTSPATVPMTNLFPTPSEQTTSARKNKTITIWRNAHYARVCDRASCRGGALEDRVDDMSLSSCKDSCYSELGCIAIRVVGCHKSADRCSGGCFRYLSHDLSQHSFNVMPSAEAACSDEDDDRCYRLVGELEWRKYLHEFQLEESAWKKKQGPLRPFSKEAYDFLFNGCCCGYESVEAAGALHLSKCAELCYGTPDCVAVEVNGCSKHSRECGNGCWIFKAQHTNRIKNCPRCVSLPGHKCYGMKMQNSSELLGRPKDRGNKLKAYRSFLAQLQLPFFDTPAALWSNSKWASYLKAVYGMTVNEASHYPIDVSSFSYLYSGIMKKAQIRLHSVGNFPPPHEYALHECMMGAVRPDAYMIHHKPPASGYQSYQNVEVTHLGGAANKAWESGRGYWMYIAPGSGIFYNVGKTETFRTHADAVKRFLNKRCGDMQCAEFYQALYKAAGKTLKSIQFIRHCDQCTANLCIHELVDLHGEGVDTCSLQFSVGLGAHQKCKCQPFLGFLDCSNLGT